MFIKIIKISTIILIASGFSACGIFSTTLGIAGSAVGTVLDAAIGIL